VLKNSKNRTILISVFFVVIFLLIKNRHYFREDWRLKAYDVHGVDISHYQSDVDFQKLKADKVQFVFVKATEGITFKDKYFKKNWEALEKEKMIRGAYHFYRPSVLAERQANEFIKTVRLKKGDLPPVLDLEKTDHRSDEIILKGVKIWLETVEAHYGVQPIIYVNQDYYKKYIQGNFENYPIWIAAYRWDKPDLPKNAWQFWQYSDKGWRDGIKERVDLNVFNGKRRDLEKLLIK
jgi:lysozyme